MQTDLLSIYSDLILKKIVTKIHADKKKKAKAEQVSMVTAETGAGVRSSRHWSAVAGSEFYYSEIETGYQRMREMDELTGWHQKLHQDRFSFMKVKYPEILEHYERYFLRE